MIQPASDSELALMRIIWSAGGQAQYAYIMEELAQSGRPWQKNTVITLLSRLVEKGLLSVNKLGRRNEYTAVVSEADYQASQTQALVNKLYAGSAKGLIATLIQQDLLSPEDYAELKRFWEGGET
ncbi:MAG: BlaI/MecI/CopY family transcriptional regulator [Oscillospiraceae bacterium]|jgi:predicted transcriptional regulator|nr:BlaI/MecI/CopY family transcriptional regulator [Oscillospiraceae bacterium]